MKNSLLLIVLFTNSLFGQFKPAKSYTIYVNNPDFTVKTSVLNSNKKVKVNSDRTYYWYSSNKIMETQGGFDGKILDGAYTSFYLSDNLKESGCFTKGLKCNEWVTWFENGKIHEITNWKKGLLHGACKLYNEKGEVIKVWNVKRNQLHGELIIYENGKIISDQKYKNGKLLPEKEVKSANDTAKVSFGDKFKSFFKKKDKPAKSNTTSPQVKPEPTKPKTEKKPEKKKKKEDSKKSSTEVILPVKN